MRSFIRMTLAAMALIYFASPTLAYDAHTIKVTGEAELTYIPDVATLNFTVITRHKDASVAKKMNDTASTLMIGVLDAIGIEAKDIFTRQLKASDWKVRKHNRDSLAGYQMKLVTTVTVDDLSKLEKVVNNVLSIPNIGISSFYFKSSNKVELQDSVRSLATRNAMKKARQMAEILGVEVIRPLTVAPGGSNFVVRGSRSSNSLRMLDSVAEPVSFGDQYGSAVGGIVNTVVKTTKEYITQIKPGELKMNGYVSITFEIK